MPCTSSWEREVKKCECVYMRVSEPAVDISVWATEMSTEYPLHD